MRTIYTFYADAARIALQSILAHKLRAFLTLIGIIIGVASVVVVGAAISGLNTYVMEKVTAVLGVNHFMMARMAHQGELSEDDWEKMNRRNKRLELEDYEWVRDNCVACSEVGAQLQNQTDLKQNGEELFGIQVQGCTPNMVSVEDKTIGDGRFFLQQEYDTAAMVVVIGDDVKEKFFPGQDPVGKTLSVRGLPMTVVGVEEKRGSMLGQSFDKVMYMPLTAYRKIFGGRQSIQIHGKAASRATFQTAIEDARTALRNKHKLKGNEDDDFGLVDTNSVAGSVDSLTGGIAAVVVPITFISLVVGGIVVMNIMLVSVTERTFEIGLRKALGATRKQMLLQFMIESSVLTTCGGILGLLLAIALAWTISTTTGVTMTVTFVYVLLSVGVSGGIGMVAGIYPAFKASRLDPIVALARK
ncbi:MAG: putative transport system permease protein [Acidobacteriota bacterium]|jgi:putative ABC transport system permease protein|nr:putative transport system permease protein [Acidobacteriota bacterium]